MLRRCLPFLAIFFVFACVPPPQEPPAEDVEPFLSDIQAKVFTPSCAIRSCHGQGSEDGGLSLEEGKARSELVDVPAFRNPAKLRVIPGDPDNSFLVQKIEGTGEGLKMPPGARVISDSAKQAIRDWISNGAEDD